MKHTRMIGPNLHTRYLMQHMGGFDNVFVVIAHNDSSFPELAFSYPQPSTGNCVIGPRRCGGRS